MPPGIMALPGKTPLLSLMAIPESPRSWTKQTLNIPNFQLSLGLELTHHKKWRQKSTHTTVNADLLEDEDKAKSWEESKRLILSLNFSSEEADSMLGKAFGWAHSSYWGEERERRVPSHVDIHELLTFLREVGLTDDDLAKLLKKFPDVLGCSLKEEVKVNVGLLMSNWGIKGKALTRLLVRNPRVLGYSVDCKGDCIAQCNRCWARF
ncbi:mitochondrial transcription termination factor family protein [Wolffia australiana]